MKETFIHYSKNGRVYRDKDFDTISRTGILVDTSKGKTTYLANTLTEFKRYKTLRGALNFMEKTGRTPVAIEDNGKIINLNGDKMSVSKSTKAPAKKCVNTQKNTATKPKKQSSRKEKVIRNYTEKNGTKIRIIKAANGKYFNEYTSHKAGAGPFETFKDAEIMLKKHRPTAIRSIKKQVKKNK